MIKCSDGGAGGGRKGRVAGEVVSDLFFGGFDFGDAYVDEWELAFASIMGGAMAGWGVLRMRDGDQALADIRAAGWLLMTCQAVSEFHTGRSLERNSQVAKPGQIFWRNEFSVEDGLRGGWWRACG